MAIVINGSGTVTGLATGGLPDGSVDSDTLASNAVTESKIANNAVVSGKIADGSIVNADVNSSAAITATKLSGVTSTVSGSSDATVSASDPTITTNPSATGHIWFNKTTGESYVCTDITTNENIWKNIGSGSGHVVPQTGLFAGDSVHIQKINISSTGNAVDWGGDLKVGSDHFSGTGGVSNGTRGVYGAAQVNGYSNTINYVTIASPADSVDFGDLSNQGYAGGSADNNTSDRGTFAGGYCAGSCGGGGMVNDIEYVTMSSAGNAADHGDLGHAVSGARGLSNSTNDRAVCSGGSTEPSNWTATNVMGYYTISGTSGASDFGDLTAAYKPKCASSNGTSNRGLIFINDQHVEYITITSTGNSTDWGDLANITSKPDSAVSNGSDDRVVVNQNQTLEYMTVSSGGSAADYGDGVASSGTAVGISDSFK
jgi:hypothetical protein